MRPAEAIRPQGPKPWRCSVAEYDRMSREGFFTGQRVELIEGRIVDMPPQAEPHVLGTTLAFRAATRVFGEQDYYVRTAAPLRQGQRSKPEPDVAVVRGNAREVARRDTPTDAVLVIEVSDSTLRYDRGKKASLYARHGIRDYWIVNLIDRQVEVHRDPTRDPNHKHGFRYASIQICNAPDAIAPLAMPDARVWAADLLP